MLWQRTNSNTEYISEYMAVSAQLENVMERTSSNTEYMTVSVQLENVVAKDQ